MIQRPNSAAPGNGAVALRFLLRSGCYGGQVQIQHLRRAVPEQYRWAVRWCWGPSNQSLVGVMRNR